MLPVIDRIKFCIISIVLSLTSVFSYCRITYALIIVKSCFYLDISKVTTCLQSIRVSFSRDSGLRGRILFSNYTTDERPNYSNKSTCIIMSVNLVAQSRSAADLAADSPHTGIENVDSTKLISWLQNV